MQEAAELLVGKKDFRSFCELDEAKQSTLVKVERAEIFTDGDLICFRIGANHFLWKMVRRIVGMLAEVGRGNLSVEGFERLVNYYSNAPAKFTAPPSGLFLEKILYQGDLPPKENKSAFRIL